MFVHSLTYTHTHVAWLLCLGYGFSINLAHGMISATAQAPATSHNNTHGLLGNIFFISSQLVWYNQQVYSQDSSKVRIPFFSRFAWFYENVCSLESRGMRGSRLELILCGAHNGKIGPGQVDIFNEKWG